MRKNGFTLIELLAVIVILAIIALIATPIILGIINDAREKANERSVELYASAVRNAVASYQLAELNSPKSFSDLNIQYEGNVECTIEELYSDGSFYLDGCKVNESEKEYSYGMDLTPSICSIEQQDKSKYSKGDVVTCNVGETPDKFYVIEDAELTATTIQMLTEKNIHTTNYRQSDSAGTVAFSSTNYWVNSNYELLAEYGNSYPADVYNTSNDIIKPIVDNYVSYLNTKLTGVTGSLLTYSQAKNLGCSESNWSCSNAQSWVYSTNYFIGSANDVVNVWHVNSLGSYGSKRFDGYGSDYSYGVRPIITISTNEI